MIIDVIKKLNKQKCNILLRTKHSIEHKECQDIPLIVMMSKQQNKAKKEKLDVNTQTQ